MINLISKIRIFRKLKSHNKSSACISSRDLLLHSLPKNSIGVEIGVHLGDFSENILTVVKPKKLFLIDPWIFEDGETYKKALYGGRPGNNQSIMDSRYENVLKRFHKQIKEGTVIVKRGNSGDLLQDFEDNSLDWVYIDGNHSYEFVKKDLELSYKKVKENGLITGDDYLDKGWWKDGVIKAVDEFSDKTFLKARRIINHQYILQK